MATIEIPVSPGRVAVVDEHDSALVSPFRWYALARKRVCYAKTTREGETLMMHRLIMGEPVGMQIDHINSDGLDNRRANLRVCTAAENRRASRSFSGTSRYKGVWWDKSRGKWRATITVNRETRYLGCFLSERVAALAYDRAATEHHGRYSLTNFSPNGDPEYLRWVSPERVHHEPHGNIGTSNGRACLTEDDVRAIRARYAEGGVTHRELAENFGISRTQIFSVINRRTWRHIP